MTDNTTGGSPITPCLIDQIPGDDTVASVSGDHAYITKDCRAKDAVQ